MNSTQAQLEAHEKECAMFRQMMDERLTNLHWSITWACVGGGALISALFSVCVAILFKVN